MDALIEPKDYIALYFSLQPLMGGGKLFAVWHSEYTRLRDNRGIWNNNCVKTDKEWSTEAAY